MTVAKVSAQDFFRAAYENRYTWDKDFPGYTADVTFNHNDKTYKGKATVTSNLKAEVWVGSFDAGKNFSYRLSLR